MTLYPTDNLTYKLVLKIIIVHIILIVYLPKTNYKRIQLQKNY